jgi:predicted double-glycine peptidase
MKRPVLAISLAIFIFVFGLTAGILLRPVLFSSASNSSNNTPFLTGVPDVRQSTTFSCGAAALQAVLSYWGIDKRERALMDELKTNEEAGTSPENIVRVAQEIGLDAYPRENLDLKDLEEAVKNKIPVICAIQAWVDSTAGLFSWDKDWEDGHYVIILGLDKRNVYVEDPSLLGTKGFIPREEFVARWHDYTGEPPFDQTDRPYIHLGIFIIGKNKAEQPLFTRVE